MSRLWCASLLPRQLQRAPCAAATELTTSPPRVKRVKRVKMQAAYPRIQARERVLELELELPQERACDCVAFDIAQNGGAVFCSEPCPCAPATQVSDQSASCPHHRPVSAMLQQHVAAARVCAPARALSHVGAQTYFGALHGVRTNTHQCASPGKRIGLPGTVKLSRYR